MNWLIFVDITWIVGWACRAAMCESRDGAGARRVEWSRQVDSSPPRPWPCHVAKNCRVRKNTRTVLRWLIETQSERLIQKIINTGLLTLHRNGHMLLSRMSATNTSREYDLSCTIWLIILSIRQGLIWHRIRQSLFQSIYLSFQINTKITAESRAWRSKHWPWACSASLSSRLPAKGTCQVRKHDFSQNATWLRQIKISQDETTRQDGEEDSRSLLYKVWVLPCFLSFSCSL